jgi:hypothetical protein
MDSMSPRIFLRSISTTGSLTLVKTNLMHNIFVLLYVYYIPLHVSSSNMLIIRRLNCINTASGIVTLCRWPFSAEITRELRRTVRETSKYWKPVIWVLNLEATFSNRIGVTFLSLFRQMVGDHSKFDCCCMSVLTLWQIYFPHLLSPFDTVQL